MLLPLGCFEDLISHSQAIPTPSDVIININSTNLRIFDPYLSTVTDQIQVTFTYLLGFRCLVATVFLAPVALNVFRQFFIFWFVCVVFIAVRKVIYSMNCTPEDFNACRFNSG